MASRTVLLASFRARNGTPHYSFSASTLSRSLRCSPSAAAFPASLRSQQRLYATASSGPSEPITTKPKASSTPSTSASATAAANANPAVNSSGVSTNDQVDAFVNTSVRGGLGGQAVDSQSKAGASPVLANATSSGSTGGAGSEPKIIVERVKRGKFRKWVVRFARTVLVVVIGSVTYIVYDAQMVRHPVDQLPHDPTKKNLVILGNGWASTSLLKDIDTEGYNVTVISPRNYFLFTPLLPSVTVGTLESRSIIEPTRFVTRHKKRTVQMIEAEATDVDLESKTVTFRDNSEIQAARPETTVPYDYLVVNVGAANQTFGIPGVTENACFLKETWDAEKIRTRLMDCIETATFKGQTEEEIRRLLHMVVVGGGPTGVEYAAELHDFLVEDLQNWYPEIAGKVRITLVEALPNVLPMFSKQLIDYTAQQFKENQIDVLTQTMVKEVKPTSIVAQDSKKNIVDIPYGLLVWATGNTTRPFTKKLIAQIGDKIQNQRRGLVVDETLKLAGAPDIWACGDATATSYAPTAQVASQQGKYLAKMFNQLTKKDELEDALEEARKAGARQENINIEGLVKQYQRASQVRPFAYSHQGSLAYVGSDKAIADIPFINGNIASGGAATFLFWRSAYISNLFSLRNKTLVVFDWVKVKIFGRDVSRE